MICVDSPRFKYQHTDSHTAAETSKNHRIGNNEEERGEEGVKRTEEGKEGGTTTDQRRWQRCCKVLSPKVLSLLHLL